MLLRTSPPFIESCLPSPGEQPSTGPDWVHEIKHDGYRLMARRDLPKASAVLAAAE
jgi:ATP-dependent DNA ligase